MTEVLRGASSNAQFTLQPWDHDPHPWYPFTLPANTPVITIVTDWYVPETAPVAIFAVFLGDYSLETLPPPPWEQGAYALWSPNQHGFGELIPQVTATSCARIHINLWLSARSGTVRATISHRDQSSIPATVNIGRDIAAKIRAQHLLANFSDRPTVLALETVAHQIHMMADVAADRFF